MITKPKFDESVFVCPGAAIVGDVTLGKNVNVWYNAVLPLLLQQQNASSAA